VVKRPACRTIVSAMAARLGDSPTGYAVQA
jgi:hypothetical protein